MRQSFTGFVLIYLSVILPMYSIAQDRALDSLLEIRKLVETDEDLLENWIQIGDRLSWTNKDLSTLYVDSALALARELGDDRQLGKAMLLLYNLKVYTGESALVSLDEIEETFDRAGYRLGVAEVYAERGLAAETSGDLLQAMNHRTRSREIYKEAGAELELHNANVDMAGLLQSMENHQEALDYLALSDDYIHRYGTTEHIAYFHLVKADALKRLKRHEEALKEYEFLRDYAIKHQYLPDVVTSGTSMGDIYLDRGDFETAEYYYLRALEDAKDFGQPFFLAYVRSGLGELAIRRGEYKTAIEYFESMSKVMNSPDSRYFMNDNWRLMAKAYSGLGEFESAYQSLARYSETQDSIHLKDAKQIAAQTEAKYKTKQQQEEITQRKRERTFAYGIAALLGLIGIGLFFGFVQKKKINQELRDLNEQREFLVKEIHHRVKNNLQIISSLLNLQVDEIEDDSAALAVAEGRNRVQSMSLIHQQLYLGENMMDIDMSKYLDDLANHLLDSLSFPGQNIHAMIDVKVPPLDVDTAIPIGLIVNELITNSMKYAFGSGGSGTINIDLYIDGSHKLVLKVEDDGTGFPAREGETKGTKFGSGLVEILSKKLKGEVQRYQADSGYQTMIRFHRFELGAAAIET